MRTRRRRAMLVGLLGFLALYGLAIGIGEASTIQNDRTHEARSTLDAAGVTNGTVTFSGREGKLTDGGPVSDGLLNELRHTWGIRRFTVEGTAPTTTTATTAAASTTAAPSTATSTTAATTTTTSTTSAATTTTAATPTTVDVTVERSATTITLTGVVLSDAERKGLVDAATAAVGAANVVDELTVASGATATATTDGDVTALAGLIGRFGTDLTTGSASLKDRALAISGTAASLAGDATLGTAVDAAKSAGIIVTGSFDVPTGSAGALAGIQFAPDSATITPASTAILDQVVAVLAAKPTLQVEVDGHTDNQGNAASNLTLSQQRAQAVVTYLVSKGIGANRLTAKGFGPTKPIADNATPAGRQQNRRIEFTVIGG